MSKINLPPITGGYNLSTINANFQKIADALDNQVLYRDNPVGEPNELVTDLDVNSQRVYNVPNPLEDHEAVNFETLKKYTQGLPDLEDYFEDLVEQAEDARDDSQAAAVDSQTSAIASAESAAEAAQSVVDASAEADRATGQADRAVIEADRAEAAAEVAIIASDALWLQLYSELIAITDRPAGTLGIVTNDPNPELNGYYVFDGTVWIRSDLQPLTDRELQELYIIAGTPVNEGYEFHNTYPSDPLITSKAKVFIDVDGSVFGSITTTGEWDLYGISTGSAEEVVSFYEFHNTLGVEGIGKAYIDRDSKVFASFDLSGNFNFLNETSSAEVGKFPLDPLTQVLGYVWYGQSLSNGSTSIPPISLVQPFFNYTFGAGPKATKAGSLGVNPGTDTVKPLIEDALAGDGEGVHGETSCSGFANYLSVLLADQGVSPSDLSIFSSTAGHGGYGIDQLNETSAWYQVWKDHITEATARMTEIGKNLVIPALNWVQGESNRSTDMRTYCLKAISLQAAQSAFVRATTGQTWDPPMLMYQTNSFNPDNTGSSSAQLWLARNFPEKFKIVVPSFIFPNNIDGLHLTNVGYKWMGAYFSRAVRDIVLNKEDANFIVPGLPIKVDLSTIRIPHLTKKPLQLLVRDITQNGYRVRVNGVSRPVTVALVESDIILTMSTPLDALSDTVTVTYAREFKTAAAAVNIRQGDLCDTDDTVIDIEGTTYDLRSWCPSYSETAILNSI